MRAVNESKGKAWSRGTNSRLRLSVVSIYTLQRLLPRNQVPVFSSLWASYGRVTADMKESRIGWQRDFL